MNLYWRSAQTVAAYLSQRDVEKMDLSSALSYFQGKKADAVIVFGNDLPQTAEAGCRAWKQGIAEWLIFCGGIGHSTEILKRRMGSLERYQTCGVYDSEAELFAEIAVKLYHVPKDRIRMDTVSSNCGQNAENARRTLEEEGIPMDRLVLIQDPLMQRRSFMSLKRAMPDTSVILSYAPFLPEFDENLNPVSGSGEIWNRERFLELLLGEIPRLRDDRNGYGPKGKNFIGHVELPPEVERAWELLYEKEAGARTRC